MVILIQLLTLGYLSLIVGLATRSRFLRIYLCFPLSFSLFARVVFVDSLVPPTIIDRLNPCVMGLNGLLRTVELLLCSGDPHVSFIRLADNGAKIADQPLWARLKWAASLALSQRGGGWNWRVPGTPPAPPRTTTSFVLHALLRWAANYLGLEVLSLVFARLGPPGTLRGPLLLLHGAMVYAALHATYELGCIAWVLLRFGGAEECPPQFGSWRDAGTLRGFWGRAWHQCFRRPITVIPNRALALCGLGPDKTAISAFFLTGMFHAITIYAITRGAIAPCVNTFLFFALQPLGFWIEDRVLGLHTRAEPKRTSTPILHLPPWLGYGWVTAWLCLTARLYFKEMVASGIYEDKGWVKVPVLTRFVTV